MFLTSLKELAVKKIVKNKLVNTYADASSDKIRTVGIILDSSLISENQTLIHDFERFGIDSRYINSIVYSTNPKQINSPFEVFSPDELKWDGSFGPGAALRFMDKSYDLLVNLYPKEKGGLLALSNGTSAKFKVGFASVNQNLNHLLIDTQQEFEGQFRSELFRYLTLLNKL